MRETTGADSVDAGNLRVVVLGCGSSGGVPRFGGDDGAGDWGACDPQEPKNRRTRCSILAQRRHPKHGFRHDRTTNLLIDTSPDMRAQLLAARCSRLDAVAYTHDHADQSHGIDDLRVFAIAQRRRIPVYVDLETTGYLLSRFDYCFEQKRGSPYPAILKRLDMPKCGVSEEVSGPAGKLTMTPFLQHHGAIDSLGFRIGDIAYSSDVVGLPEESFDILDGVGTWIVDALQHKPHATHAHLDLALKWIERVKPKRAILTNMHVHMDYQTLKRTLPQGVEPAYDGMAVFGDA
ncbi:MAG: MBL fold metallo-hydrolase [Pseudomonadota bacterium]